MPEIQVNSQKVKYNEEHIESEYDYSNTVVSREGGKLTVTPITTKYTFKTERKVRNLQ